MDLIHQYYSDRHDVSLAEKFELKKRRISEWQKRMVLSRASIMTISAKQIKKRLKRKLRSASTKSILSVAEHKGVPQKASMHRMTHQSGVTVHEPRNLYILEKLHEDFQKDKSTSPISKFEEYEKKTRRSFRRRYAEYFPDSMDVIEDVLDLMFGKADDSFMKSININTQGITYVPETTAKIMGKKFSIWEQIHDLVKFDLEEIARSQKLPSAAFGRTLENNVKKCTVDSRDFKVKWQSYRKTNAYYEDLASFSAVWKHITNLQTTRMFCLWLAKHPQVQVPDYLAQTGLLDEDASYELSTMSDMSYADYESPALQLKRHAHRLEHFASSCASSDSSLSKDISDVNIIV